MAELTEAMTSLSAAGAASYYYQIQRRPPGELRWFFWRQQVPVNEVDDVAAFCKQSDPSQEYRVTLFQSNGARAVDENGNVLPRFVVGCDKPAKPEPEPANGTTAAGASDVQDRARILAERRRLLMLRREQMEIEKREKQLDREEERLEKGELEPPEPEPVPMGPPAPVLLWDPRVRDYVPAPPDYTGHQNGGDIAKVLLEVAPKLIEAMRPKESPLDVMVKILPLLKQETLRPGEMLDMFKPLISEIGKLGAESQRVVMEQLASSDKAFRRRMMDMVMATGAGDDEVARWERILGVVSSNLEKGVKTVFGRASILKAGDKIRVPVIGKPNAPALPAPKAPAPALPGTVSASPPTPPTESPASPAPAASGFPTPDEMAEARASVVRERVATLLTIAHQEMLLPSRPDFAAGQCAGLYGSLPEDLRDSLETATGHEGVASILKALSAYQPEMVARLTEDVAKSPEKRKQWCEVFWDVVRFGTGEDEEE